jgi:hypothetical protein
VHAFVQERDRFENLLGGQMARNRDRLRASTFCRTLLAKNLVVSMDDARLSAEKYVLSAYADEPALNGFANHRRSSRYLQFSEHVLHVRLHRAFGDAKAVANFLVALPLRD